MVLYNYSNIYLKHLRWNIYIYINYKITFIANIDDPNSLHYLPGKLINHLFLKILISI
jgi:hypothetical protein